MCDDKPKDKPKLKKSNSDSSGTEWNHEIIRDPTIVLPISKSPSSSKDGDTKSNDVELFDKSLIDSINNNFEQYINNQIKSFKLAQFYNDVLFNNEPDMSAFITFLSAILYKLQLLNDNFNTQLVNQHLQTLTSSKNPIHPNYILFIINFVLNLKFKKVKNNNYPLTPVSLSSELRNSMYA